MGCSTGMIAIKLGSIVYTHNRKLSKKQHCCGKERFNVRRRPLPNKCKKISYVLLERRKRDMIICIKTCILINLRTLILVSSIPAVGNTALISVLFCK